MMKMPEAERARVEKQKLVEYLLSPSHPAGGSKAEFFSSFGYSANRWRELASAFEQLAVDYPVTAVVESRHGVRYTVDGALKAPDGRTPWVRTVWVSETGRIGPRLVTAYPLQPRG